MTAILILLPVGARNEDSPGKGGLSDGGHDDIHGELLCAAGRDLHRHRVRENQTGPHQEVMATPEHTWRAEQDGGVSMVQAALPCKSGDEHYCLAQQSGKSWYWARRDPKAAQFPFIVTYLGLLLL